jgi:hypothetical protein
LALNPGHWRASRQCHPTAQALVEGLPLVSGDSIFDAYGVVRLWK